MAGRWRIKPNRNLRDNARLLVPLMFDDLLSRKDRVVGHPRLKLDLHRMRLSGKTLRYAMEVFDAAFQTEFAECLEEVKRLLEMMGSIHDCDVNIPRLQGHLREIRSFNRNAASFKDKIGTSALTRMIREHQARRQGLFTEMSSILEQWEREDFKGKLIHSMTPN